MWGRHSIPLQSRSVVLVPPCPKGLNPSEAIAELKFKMVERQI
ncbi:MAG: hypothetical protein C207_04746 [Bradyrhizobium sp. DFCI-1]|jgi:hypothetical protein|nr:MAG: hypothetical protein C207_04746 [Bradyrhizobium sp. DFCI-1]